MTQPDIVDPQDSILYKCDTTEMTGSFLHLHIAINATGLDLDQMEAHYTVMDRSLAGDGTSTNGVTDGPCGELNMIAVSNPCVIDNTLAPEGYMVVHAYGAGNEPYHVWEGIKRKDPKYEKLKQERSEVLWRAIESVIPDVRDRVVLDLVGSPLTHERFLRRPRGTYGAATEDYLKDGSTPFPNLILAGDSIFPGIGVPAVAISGASAANGLVNVFQQWRCLDALGK
jgi:phytoene dehydrogenase-like protein